MFFPILVILLHRFSKALLNPEEFVHLLAGTFTDGRSFSTGNTLPLIGLPWGFNHWAPQTAEGNRFTDSWWFDGNSHEFKWFRCTHQPSPWIGDWGWFLFGPQMGRIDHNPTMFWEPRAAIIKPYLFDALFAPNGIRFELSPTMHGAIARITFPNNEHINTEKRLCFREADWSIANENNLKKYVKVILGKSTQVHIDRLLVSNFNMYIRIETDNSKGIRIESAQDMMCFRYERDTSTAVVRIATSLISAQQAQVNLNRELPVNSTFDDVLKQAKHTWNA